MNINQGIAVTMFEEIEVLNVIENKIQAENFEKNDEEDIENDELRVVFV